MRHLGKGGGGNLAVRLRSSVPSNQTVSKSPFAQLNVHHLASSFKPNQMISQFTKIQSCENKKKRLKRMRTCTIDVPCFYCLQQYQRILSTTFDNIEPCGERTTHSEGCAMETVWLSHNVFVPKTHFCQN